MTPATADGNFTRGATHTPDPAAVENASVPHGTVSEFTVSSAGSRICAGIVRGPETFGGIGNTDPAGPAKRIVTASHRAHACTRK